MKQKPPLLTVKQVAERLNVSPQTVFKWSRKGTLPGIKLGYLLRFDPEAVEAFIDRSRAA